MAEINLYEGLKRGLQDAKDYVDKKNSQLSSSIDEISDVKKFADMNDFIGNIEHPVDPTDKKGNILKAPYELDDFERSTIVMSNGKLGYNADTYKAMLTSPLIEIDGGKTYAIKTTGIGTQKNNGLLPTNDGYGLFASDGNTVVPKTSFQNLGNNIALIKTTEGSKYIRLVFYCTGTVPTEEAQDQYYRQPAVNSFNTWVMIETTKTSGFTDADFIFNDDAEDTTPSEDSSISIIKRADGSVLEIVDLKARKKSTDNAKDIADIKAYLSEMDGFETEVVQDGNENVLSQPYADNTFIRTSIILSIGSIRTDATRDINYLVTDKVPVKPNKAYAVLTGGSIYKAVNGCIGAVNDGYGLFKSDLSVSAKVYSEKRTDAIFVFRTNSDTAFVRFCLYNNQNYDSSFLAATSAFNTWYMIEIESTDVLITEEMFKPKLISIKGLVPNDNTVGYNSFVDKKALLPLYGKKIVNFGDSIYGNVRPPMDVSTHIENLTGAKVYNGAFGGCRMAKHIGHWDAFSMYRLADAIATGDWSLQDTALGYDDRTSYAEAPLATLKSVDWATVDTITIAYGSNDYNGNNRLENSDNNKDTDYYGGALRYSIERILSAYPNIKIVIISSTWRWYMDANKNYTESSDEAKNDIRLSIADYNQKAKEIADEYHLPFIDNYTIGINKHNRLNYFSTSDGAHHTKNGIDLLARHIVNELW